MDRFDENLTITPRTTELFFSWQGPFRVEEYTYTTHDNMLQVHGDMRGLFVPDWSEDFLSFQYSDGPYNLYRGRMVRASLLEFDDKEAVFQVNEEIDGFAGRERPRGRPHG